MTGVAEELSVTNYDTQEYKTLYDSLLKTISYEQSLFEQLNIQDQNVLN